MSNESYRSRLRELKKIYKTVLPHARQTITEGNQLLPAVFAQTPQGMIITALQFTNLQEKRAAYDAVGKELRERKASGAVVLNDIWYVRAPDLDAGSLPSEHPARKEALYLMLCTYGYTAAYTHPYRREAGRIIWEPEEFTEKVTNIYFRLFEEGVQ